MVSEEQYNEAVQALGKYVVEQAQADYAIDSDQDLEEYVETMVDILNTDVSIAVDEQMS